MASSTYCTPKVNDCFDVLHDYFADSFNDDDEIAAVLMLFLEGIETWELQYNNNLKEVREKYKAYAKTRWVYDNEGKKIGVENLHQDTGFDMTLVNSLKE